MAVIDFPIPTTIGQEYTFEGKVWKWNGTGWALSDSEQDPVFNEWLSTDPLSVKQDNTGLSGTDLLNLIYAGL